MCTINSITFLSQIPSHWNLVFLSAAILGIYLSLVIAFSKKTRLQHRFFLGLFTTLLAILLLSITRPLVRGRILDNLIAYGGVASIYLIGPLSYRIFTSTGRSGLSLITFLYLLPALFSLILFGGLHIDGSWRYAGGILWNGCFLLLQSIYLFWKSISDEQSLSPSQASMLRWNKRYTLIQLLLFAVICISILTSKPRLVIACAVTILILVIWIRLLFTAYDSYSINNQ